jgi:site-specific DNA-methyltransferase (adenine-specific)
MKTFKSGSVELLHMDCMEYMCGLPDKAFELAIVDPPYGQNALDGSRAARIYGVNRKDNWDCARPSKDYFKELFRVSRHQIIWGGNYFISDLADTKCFVIWDKPSMSGMHTMSFGEMAWTSFDSPAKKIKMESDKVNRLHPTQKPVKLYEWLLSNYAKEGDRILDTHLGSGSSAIAAHYAGFDFVGMELDPDYCAAAVKRFQQETAQQALNI